MLCSLQDWLWEHGKEDCWLLLRPLVAVLGQGKVLKKSAHDVSCKLWELTWWLVWELTWLVRIGLISGWLVIKYDLSENWLD
jgi:hypothetical protein